MEFVRYDTVPTNVAQPIIAAHKKVQTAESEE
jgi:hypothetical protein